MELTTLTQVQLDMYKQITVPVLITFYIITNILFLIIGHLSVKKAHGKIWLIWFLGLFLFDGMVLVVFTLFPNLVVSILNFIIPN